jgi:RHH-type rel operon transcriptional repressor/antitoxin RelB
MLAVRLPEDLEKRLEALAKRTGRTKSYYVREAIVEHLDDLEDLYLAEARLQALRRGDDLAVPIDELMQRHGAAGHDVAD